MRYRYILYLILVALCTLLAMNYSAMNSVKDRLNEDKKRLLQLERELNRKEREIRTLAKMVRELGIKQLDKETALKQLLTFIDDLRKSYEVEIIKELENKGSFWEVGVLIKTKVSSGEEVYSVTKDLISSVSPIVEIKRLEIDTLNRKLEIRLDLKQPYHDQGGVP